MQQSNVQKVAVKQNQNMKRMAAGNGCSKDEGNLGE